LIVQYTKQSHQSAQQFETLPVNAHPLKSDTQSKPAKKGQINMKAKDVSHPDDRSLKKREEGVGWTPCPRY